MPSTLVETAVAANCTSDHTQLKSLVPCLVEALSSDDWATRWRRSWWLLTWRGISYRSLRVKLVRDVMNQMLEAWKLVPNVSDEVSPPPKSQSSSKENASDGHYPQVSQNSCSPRSMMANLQKKSTPFSRFTPVDSSSTSNAKNTSASTHLGGQPCKRSVLSASIA
ncbi:hypothetical protein JHK87_024754 [Glycine soja]|nr:hypothetical protein JHK87_024754 [Glycine soja]